MSTYEQKTAAPLELGPADDGRRLTAEEFASADYAEPWTYGRVQGRLVVMSPEGVGHVRASNPWLERLIVYKFHHPGIVDMVVPQAWVRPDDDHDRFGDIGVYLVHEGRVLGIPAHPPDLMFEIVSRGKADRRRDYVEKRAEYHRAGIREYVIIDRFRNTVTVLSHEPAGYREHVLTIDDTYRTPLLPGFEVRLTEVLR